MSRNLRQASDSERIRAINDRGRPASFRRAQRPGARHLRESQRGCALKDMRATTCSAPDADITAAGLNPQSKKTETPYPEQKQCRWTGHERPGLGEDLVGPVREPTVPSEYGHIVRLTPTRCPRPSLFRARRGLPDHGWSCPHPETVRNRILVGDRAGERLPNPVVELGRGDRLRIHWSTGRPRIGAAHRPPRCRPQRTMWVVPSVRTGTAARPCRHTSNTRRPRPL